MNTVGTHLLTVLFDGYWKKECYIVMEAYTVIYAAWVGLGHMSWVRSIVYIVFICFIIWALAEDITGRNQWNVCVLFSVSGNQIVGNKYIISVFCVKNNMRVCHEFLEPNSLRMKYNTSYNTCYNIAGCSQPVRLQYSCAVSLYTEHYTAQQTALLWRHTQSWHVTSFCSLGWVNNVIFVPIPAHAILLFSYRPISASHYTWSITH